MGILKKVRHFISGDKFFQCMVTVFLIILAIVILYPLIYIVSASFSDADAVKAGELVLLPVGFTTRGYEYIFLNKELWVGYGNTIFYTVVGTMINLVVTLPCAYALSRKDVVGKKQIMIFFMITMYVSGGLIPGYLNVKSFGLIDTRTIILIGGALSVYNLIVARTFFANSIPYEITEAAQIDGCSDLQTFSRIVMPLSKALTAVMVLYYGVGHWNSYFNAMIYLDDRSKYPLQLFLREILLQSKLIESSMMDSSLSPEDVATLMEVGKSADLAKYCVIVMAALPMMIVYPKLQKFFEKGVMIGSIKG